jgi:hypothetical protein
MIHSTSPHARKIVKAMYTCDPYDVDIKLDNDATSRGAEIINTRLKVVGRVLRFVKIPKRRIKFSVSPIKFEQAQVKEPIRFIKDDPNMDIDKFYKEQDKFRAKVAKDEKVINPIRFAGIDTNVQQEQYKLNKEALEWSKLNMREKAERVLKEEKDKEAKGS